MSDYKILSLKDKSYELQMKFIKKFDQKWNLRESVEELAIQTGHLYQSLVNNGRIDDKIDAHNQPNRILNNIKDELCDCFLSICSIYVFLGIKKDEEINYVCEQDKNEKTLVAELAILSAQLLDSCLILEGIKPSFKRTERQIFLQTYFAMITILECVAKKENIDIEYEFDAMIARTMDFLERE